MKSNSRLELKDYAFVVHKGTTINFIYLLVNENNVREGALSKNLEKQGYIISKVPILSIGEGNLIREDFKTQFSVLFENNTPFAVYVNDMIKAEADYGRLSRDNYSLNYQRVHERF